MRSIAGLLSVLTIAMVSNAAVIVNCSKNEGPILQSGNGFLWGISTTAPHDTMISRLRPKMLRAGAQSGDRCAFEIYDRAKSLGVQEIQAIVCEAVGFRQPGTAGLSWDSYLSTVTNLVNRAKTENKQFVWDIWNEPDWGDFWGGTWEEWLEVWKRTYQAIKAVDPNAITLGPSTAEVPGGIIKTTSFIAYCAANNCMPEIICWHLNTSGYWIGQHKTESDAHLVRLQLANLGYDTTKIQLSSNEYGDGGYASNSGGCVEYFAQMERARFVTGAKACWSGTDCGGNLCGIVGTSNWWAYRRYGEMTGSKFNVAYSSADKVDGVATFDSTTHTLKVLLGSSSKTSSTVALRIINCGGSGTVSVKVEKIGNPPQVISTSNASIVGDSLRIDIPNFGGTDAFLVTVSNFTYQRGPAQLASIVVSPANTVVKPGQTMQFRGLALDQYGDTIKPQPSVSWSVSGGGTMSSSGLFAAGTNAGGPYTVTASATVGALTRQGAATLLLADPKTQGLTYDYYEGTWNIVPDFGTLTAVETGTVPNFDISVANRADNFAFNFTGFISIFTAGQYTFTTGSDDGSVLKIDGQLVVNNDGGHAPTDVSGSLALTPGMHTIAVGYLEINGGQELTVRWAGPGVTAGPIPSSVLFSTNSATALRGLPAVAGAPALQVLADALVVSERGNTTVQVVNTGGRIVRTAKVAGTGRVSLRDLVPGVYQASIRSLNGTRTVTIVRD